MADSVRKLRIELDGSIGGFQASMKQAGASLDRLSDGAEKMRSSFRLSFTELNQGFEVAKKGFAGLEKIGEVLIDLGTRGAAVSDLAEGFAALSSSVGAASEQMLGALREGVAGTLSDFDLMQLANKALGAGLIKTTEDMKTLSEGARALAKRTGGDTKEAFDTLTSAIASGRTAQLKQLGLFVDSKVAVEAFAKSVGKSVSDLTDAERAQALSAATLAQLKQELLTAAPPAADFGERIEQVRSALTNLRDSIGVIVAGSFVDLANQFAGVGVSVQDATEPITFFVNVLANGMVNAASIVRTMTQNISDDIQLLGDAFRLLKAGDISGAATALKGLKSATDGVTLTWKDYTAVVGQGTTGTKVQTAATKELTEAQKKAAAEMKKLIDQLSGAAAQEEVDKLTVAFHALGVKGVADLEALRKKLEQLQQQGAKITDKGLLGVLGGGKIEIPKALDLDLGIDIKEMPGLLAQSQAEFNGIAQAAAAAGLSTEEIKDALESAGASGGALEVALSSIPITFGSEMKKALAGLPQVILGAIQGGGDVGKAVGAHLGGSILQGLAGPDGPLGKGLTDLLGKTLGGALGSILPGLGSIIGSKLGSLVGKGLSAIGSAFGIGGNKVVMQVNDMRDAFFDAEGGWLAFSQKMAAVSKEDWAKKIFNARTVEDFNRLVKEAKGLLNSQGEAQQALADATQRYGFTIEELGPAMQRQELDSQAGQLLQDFKLLTASGIDVGTVIGKMGPNLLEFVNTSKAAGQAIPEAMRPMIDQLIASGQLLDENGQAFTSAEEAGITFAQTMSEQFSTLIEKIDAMVSALTGIPSDVSTTVHVKREDSGVPAGSPGPGDVPSFASGGIGDFGSGSLAVLHGREAIIPLDRMGEGLGGDTYNVDLKIDENPLQTFEGVRRQRDFTLRTVRRDLTKSLAQAVAAGRA